MGWAVAWEFIPGIALVEGGVGMTYSFGFDGLETIPCILLGFSE